MQDTSRSYPKRRKPRGERRSDDLTMLSARIDNELNEYVRTTAFETRQSKQEIVSEALRLHREYYQANRATK